MIISFETYYKNNILFLPYKDINIQSGKHFLMFKLRRTCLGYLKCFKNRLYDYNLSKDETLLKALKTKMDFTLSEDDAYIYFNKLKENSISIFIFGNYNYKIINNDEIDYKNESIKEFIFNSIDSVIEEFYEKIKLFVENKQMVFYFNIISGCLKDIYTSTSDQELYDTFNTLFEPCNSDPKYLQKKLTKNFMLCSSKK